jgi:aminopeptidase N
LGRAIGAAHEAAFSAFVDDLAIPGPYDPNPADAGRRALRLKALGYLAQVGRTEPAAKVFDAADNMTESLGSLAILIKAGVADRQAGTFYARWKHDPNTLDKWFSASIVNAAPDEAVAKAQELSELPEFVWKTPNRFRAVVGGLAGNTAAFHHASGEGYRFVAEWLKRLDPVNPMTAARMATVFETWARYDGDRQGQIKDALAYLLEGDPSKDLSEIATRILGTQRSS